MPLQQFTAIVEGQYVGDWLKHEADALRSREEHTILAGSGSDRVLTSGMILALSSVTGTAVAIADAGNTGDGVMGAITVSAGAKKGKYRLLFKSAAVDLGDFEIEDPDGLNVGRGTVASAFALGGLAFTLADGAADYIVGDGFDIDVDITVKKFIQQDRAATDFTEDAVALLLLDTTAPDGQDVKATLIVREAIISKDAITYPTSATAPEKVASLAQLSQFNILDRERA